MHFMESIRVPFFKEFNCRNTHHVLSGNYAERFYNSRSKAEKESWLSNIIIIRKMKINLALIKDFNILIVPESMTLLNYLSGKVLN